MKRHARHGSSSRHAVGYLTTALLLSGLFAAAPASAQWLLVPMDRDQRNHLRAYGLTYWTLEQEEKSEWLLNYRGGSFLLPDRADIRREAALRGVTIVPIDAPGEARIRATIADSNMEAVPLERAPKVAIYTPPNSTPSYRFCARRMVRVVLNFSLRDASCCSVDVVKGGGGLRVVFLRSISATRTRGSR